MVNLKVENTGENPEQKQEQSQLQISMLFQEHEKDASKPQLDFQSTGGIDFNSTELPNNIHHQQH